MVRCIQRVDELLKNIRLAARNLESKEFEEKLERASRLIRRDIVFAPSLYTAGEGVVGVFEEEESKPQTVVKKEKEVSQEVLEEKNELDDNEEEDDEDFEDDDEDDALFTYNFAANDEETLNSENFHEEEQFNSNFL